MVELEFADHLLRDLFATKGFDRPRDSDLEAIEVERRAIQRAYYGVRTASEIASTHNLSAAQTLHLQFGFFIKAAWPTNERVDASSHSTLLNKLRIPLFFSQIHEQTHAQAGLVVPLAQLLTASALHGAVGDVDDDDDECDESNSSSFCSSGGSVGSIGFGQMSLTALLER